MFGRLGVISTGFATLGATRGFVSIRITVALEALNDEASVSDPAGQASILGVYTGTPTWSLTDDAGGKYAIDSSTGAITVAGALSEGTDSITVAVSGTTPDPDDKVVSIVVSAAPSSGLTGQPMGMLLSLTYAA